jgi:hypothetical protein
MPSSVMAGMDASAPAGALFMCVEIASGFITKRGLMWPGRRAPFTFITVFSRRLLDLMARPSDACKYSILRRAAGCY